VEKEDESAEEMEEGSNPESGSPSNSSDTNVTGEAPDME
jgi:hypothetical protein